jgi:hypothetical protein
VSSLSGQRGTSIDLPGRPPQLSSFLLTWHCHVVVVVSVCSDGSGHRTMAVEGGGCRSRWWVVNVDGGGGSERKLIVDC